MGLRSRAPTIPSRRWASVWTRGPSRKWLRLEISNYLPSTRWPSLALIKGLQGISSHPLCPLWMRAQMALCRPTSSFNEKPFMRRLEIDVNVHNGRSTEILSSCRLILVDPNGFVS